MFKVTIETLERRHWRGMDVNLPIEFNIEAATRGAL